MLARSDTLVFSGSQTCGIILFLTRAESSFGEQKVKDSDRLELDWLLKCKLEELIASVRPMSAKNCEQIVRAILDQQHSILRIRRKAVRQYATGGARAYDDVIENFICHGFQYASDLGRRPD